MSQRESGYERKPLDLYETPEWVTRALIGHLPRVPQVVWEPACGSGKIMNITVNPDGVSIKGCSIIYAPKGQAGEDEAAYCLKIERCATRIIDAIDGKRPAAGDLIGDKNGWLSHQMPEELVGAFYFCRCVASI